MENLLEKFLTKPSAEQLESARIPLEKDFAYGLERLQTSPLLRELSLPKDVPTL